VVGWVLAFSGDCFGAVAFSASIKATFEPPTTCPQATAQSAALRIAISRLSSSAIFSHTDGLSVPLATDLPTFSIKADVSGGIVGSKDGEQGSCWQPGSNFDFGFMDL
jgi:hypothetical protein